MGKLFVVLSALALAACATNPPTSKQAADVSQYRFVVIERSNVIRGMAADGGRAVAREVDPSTLLEGLLLKKGLVRVASSDPPRSQTLILRWGISGKRNLPLAVGYAQEVSIALLDAQTLSPVFSCTGEGLGETDADDIRDAISSCLSTLR